MGHLKLGYKIGNVSSSSKREQHSEAQTIPSTFNPVEGLSLAESPSSIWTTFKVIGNLHYANEATMAKYVSSVLYDIILAIGQQGRIHIVEEMKFREMKPDVWLI